MNTKAMSTRIPLKFLKKCFTIPYFNKIPEKFKSITKRFDFNIIHKPINYMNTFFKIDKDKIKKENHSNVVLGVQINSIRFFVHLFQNKMNEQIN